MVAFIAGLLGTFGGVLINAGMDLVFTSRPERIQSEVWLAGYADSEGWNLSSQPDAEGNPAGGKPAGTRTFFKHVDFRQPFPASSKVKVFLSVDTMDVWNKTDIKWDAEPANINNKGFDIEIRALDDCVLFSVGGNWIAFEQ